MVVTQKKIAADLGISLMTVYRCLSGKGYVGVRTRKRINGYIRRHNYRLNLTARSLKLKKNNTVGLVVPAFSYSYYPEIIESIRRTLGRKYNLLLSLSDDSDETEHAALEMLMSIPVDGILLSPAGSPASLKTCRQMREQGVPFVLFDRCFPRIDDYPVVSTNCADSSAELITHLASLGHRKIAHIGGKPYDSFAAQMLKGYKAGLKRNGLAFDKRLVKQGPLTEQFGNEAMKQLLDAGIPFSAVHAGNDPVAIGVMAACRERGISVPRDISVTGFSDISVSKHLDPPLTTVREPTADIGSIAADLLIRQIEKTAGNGNEIILLPGQFVLRASTAPAADPLSPAPWLRLPQKA